MSALIVLVAGIYASSIAVMAGGGLLYVFSPRFRREIMDEPPSIG